MQPKDVPGRRQGQERYSNSTTKPTETAQRIFGKGQAYEIKTLLCLFPVSLGSGEIGVTDRPCHFVTAAIRDDGEPFMRRGAARRCHPKCVPARPTAATRRVGWRANQRRYPGCKWEEGMSMAASSTHGAAFQRRSTLRNQRDRQESRRTCQITRHVVLAALGCELTTHRLVSSSNHRRP